MIRRSSSARNAAKLAPHPNLLHTLASASFDRRIFLPISWKSLFPDMQPRLVSSLTHAESILANTSVVAGTLSTVEKAVRERLYPNGGQPNLDAYGNINIEAPSGLDLSSGSSANVQQQYHHSQVLHEVLTSMEAADGWDEPVVIKHQLTVEEFMGLVKDKKILYDSGVSPHHGVHSHRLQLRFLQQGGMKPDDVREMLSDMATLRFKRDCDCLGLGMKATVWDFIFDRPAEYMWKNCEKLPSKDIFSCTQPTTVDLDDMPTSTAHSPENLAFFMRNCPADAGLTVLRGVLRHEFQAAGDKVHEDVFGPKAAVDSRSPYVEL